MIQTKKLEKDDRKFGFKSGLDEFKKFITLSLWFYSFSLVRYKHIDDVDWESFTERYSKVAFVRSKVQEKLKLVSEVKNLKGIESLREMDAGFFRLFLLPYRMKENMVKIFELDDPNLSLFKSFGLKHRKLNSSIIEQFDQAAQFVTRIGLTRKIIDYKLDPSKLSSLEELKRRKAITTNKINLHEALLDEDPSLPENFTRDKIKEDLESAKRELVAWNKIIKEKASEEKLFEDARKTIKQFGNSDDFKMYESLLARFDPHERPDLDALLRATVSKEHRNHLNEVDPGLLKGAEQKEWIAGIGPQPLGDEKREVSKVIDEMSTD